MTIVDVMSVILLPIYPSLEGTLVCLCSGSLSQAVKRNIQDVQKNLSIAEIFSNEIRSI